MKILKILAYSLIAAICFALLGLLVGVAVEFITTHISDLWVRSAVVLGILGFTIAFFAQILTNKS